MEPAEIPAPSFTLTNGRKPRTGSKKLQVQFRHEGRIDDQHSYTADQLRWDDTGHPFDVVAVRIT